MADTGPRPQNTLRAEGRRQQRRIRRLRVFGLGLAGLAVALGGGWQWVTSAPSNAHAPVPVTIPRGANSLDIGRLLTRQGVVRNPYAFALQTRLTGANRELRAGRHDLYSDMPLEQVVETLAQKADAGVDENGLRVTIPEGYTLRQIADTLGAKGVCSASEFYRLATDQAFIAGLQSDFALPRNTLEGYLFPDTYTFKSNTTPAAALQAMLTNFGAHFARPYQQEISAGGRALHNVVTIASLIEREARVDADRARIAGVIDNRLKRNMRLEIDATVLYALGRHKSRVLYKDLRVNSPYNTYRHAGLPPGPIASPGLPCLLAALNPESNPFLYYVARPDGSHIFTRTPAEHQAAIRQARQERRQQATVEPDRPEETRP